MSSHRQFTPSPSNDTTGTNALLPEGFPAYDGTQKCADTDVDGDLFFPTSGQEAASSRAAERICRGCAFRAPCGEWALTHPAEQGIWAGMTERERNRIRKRVA